MSHSRIVSSLLALAMVGVITGCVAQTPTHGDPTTEQSFEVQNGYIPVAVGNTWVYTMTYAEPVGIVTETETILAVTPDGAGGAEVDIQRDFHYENGSRPDYSDLVAYQFHADGSIELPFEWIPRADSTSVITATGGRFVWPSDSEFAAGTATTGEINLLVEADGEGYDETVSFEIAGAGEESVTAPLGAFTARKLVQNLIVSVPSFDVEVPLTVTSWFHAEVGLVRTEIPDAFGGPTITVELVSFTPAG